MINTPTPFNLPYGSRSSKHDPVHMGTVYPMMGYTQALPPNQQTNGNGDSYGASANPSFSQQHLGACNSMQDACRHYLVEDVAPRMLDYAPTATQMGAMWLRELQNRAMVKQDQAEVKPIPRPGMEAARAVMGNVIQGVGRFFV